MDPFAAMESAAMTLTAKPHAFAGAILTPKHARELTPSLCLAITSALAEQAYRKDAIPYTSWITEAWKVLGWSEPRYVLTNGEVNVLLLSIHGKTPYICFFLCF